MQLRWLAGLHPATRFLLWLVLALALPVLVPQAQAVLALAMFGVLAAVVSDTVTGGGPLAAGPVSDGPEQAASRKVRQASGRIQGMATRQSGK